MARLLSICNKTLCVMHTLIGSKCSIRIRNHYNNMQEERRNPRARLSHEMRKYVGLTGHEQEIRLLLSEHCLPIHPLCLSSHLPPTFCALPLLLNPTIQSPGLPPLSVFLSMSHAYDFGVL